MGAQPGQLYTIKDAEGLLSCSRTKVKDLIAARQLERVYLAPRAPRITGRSLAGFVQALEERRPPPTYEPEPAGRREPERKAGRAADVLRKFGLAAR